MEYRNKNKIFLSKDEFLEDVKNDNRKEQNERDEVEIRRLQIKHLKWSNRKTQIWIVVTTGPFIILGVIKLIELVQKWFKP